MSLGHPFELTWYGHSTFMLKTASGKKILFDPWLKENPACPDKMKKIDAVDVMLISHGHFDHIGDAVEVALQHKPTVVGNYELCSWLGSKGVQNTIGMNKGGTVKVGDIQVTMVSADHSCGIADKDGSGKDVMIYGGEACGFVVTLEDGFKVYFAGDTNVFGDMKLIGELYEPDLAMLPIGGHFTMSPKEAAMALRLLGINKVVPMHYGTFPVLAGTPAALNDAAADIDGLEVASAEPGDTIP